MLKWLIGILNGRCVNINSLPKKLSSCNGLVGLQDLRLKGKQCIAAGEYDEAIRVYEAALEIDNDSVDLLTNISYVHLENGQVKQAEKYLRQAAIKNNNDIDVVFLLGIACKELGNFSEAVENFQAAINLRDDFEQAYQELCYSLSCLGRNDEAISVAEKGLRINWLNPIFHNYHGNLLYGKGELGTAILSFRKAIEIYPGFSEAYSNLGVCYIDMNMYPDAVECYKSALLGRPDNASDLGNLGLALLSLGYLGEAVEKLRLAINSAPNLASAHHVLGDAYRLQGDLGSAVVAYRKALCIDPFRDKTYNNLGITYQLLGDLEAASNEYNKALSIDPNCAALHNNLAGVCRDLGELKLACAGFERALVLKPDYLEALGNLLFVLEYSNTATREERFNRALEYGDLVSQKAGGYLTSSGDTGLSQKIRVGFVSGDIRSHPVGFFLEQLLANIDRDSFELFAYITQPTEDDLSRRVEKYFVAKRSLVGFGDKAAATLIHADRLNVLIDLAGHTTHNRLPVFAWRPAPVQVSWLGYFATTGLREIDFVLADPVSVLPAQEQFFSEKIWYLPNSRLCFTPPLNEISVTSLPAISAVQNQITFGCFQNSTKVSNAVLALWSRVILKLPNSKLRWQAPQFHSKKLAHEFLERFSRFGVPRERIELFENTDREEYLRAHNEVDMILDAFPYTGGTTTCEALWMGVPTLTLAGDSMLSRQGASLLIAAGLSGWVAESPDQFVSKAIEFAKNITALANLRKNLRAQMLSSPLCDGGLFARDFETALRGMLQQNS